MLVLVPVVYTKDVTSSKRFKELSASKVAKGAEPIAMITAYDAPSMRFAQAGGADIVLVGDSVATVMLGYESTMQMTHEEMLVFVKAVARTSKNIPVVADMVWGSYHVNTEQSVQSAIDLIHAGAQAVKLEGGTNRVEIIEAITNAEIPVVGHVGLTPQSLLEFGEFKVQGKELDKAQKVLEDARAVASAGASMIVVECVPDALSRAITEELSIPVIGIGAGKHTDGQVLVMHDLLGIGQDSMPKFVRQYEQLEEKAVAAVAGYVADVKSGAFPSPAETYHMADGVVEELQNPQTPVQKHQTPLS